MMVFHMDLQLLKTRLKSNGFPLHVIDSCTKSVLDRHHVQQTTTSVQEEKEKVVLALPYLGPMSIVLRRKLRTLVHRFYPNVELQVVFRRGFRLSNLFTFKDKFPLSCRSMVVYYISCRECGPSQAYIGKTINTIYERFHASGSGHLNPRNIESALLNHAADSDNPNCGFNFNDVKILESGNNDQQIRFIESILLKYDKQNLNTCERSVKLEIV